MERLNNSRVTLFGILAHGVNVRKVVAPVNQIRINMSA